MNSSDYFTNYISSLTQLKGKASPGKKPNKDRKTHS